MKPDVPQATSEQQQGIFGLNFSELTADQVIATLIDVPAERMQLVVTCNLDHVVQLHKNPSFQNAYRTAWLTTVDGMPVFLYQKLQGGRAPMRVTGADILPALMKKFDPDRHRPFFIVANDAIGHALASDLTDRGFMFEQSPFLTAPFGFETNLAVSAAMIQQIRNFKPTHLILGIGAPKSEIWLAKNADQIGRTYALPIGAALEFYLGHKKRAPMMMRRIGLEGVWRLAQEPRRLWRRYMVDSWTFVAAVRMDRRNRTKAARPS